MSWHVVHADEFGVDVEVHPDVLLEFSRSDRGELEVWAIRIEGKLYREPLDGPGERMPSTSEFAQEVNEAARRFEAERKQQRADLLGLPDGVNAA